MRHLDDGLTEAGALRNVPHRNRASGALGRAEVQVLLMDHVKGEHPGANGDVLIDEHAEPEMWDKWYEMRWSTR